MGLWDVNRADGLFAGGCLFHSRAPKGDRAASWEGSFPVSHGGFRRKREPKRLGMLEGISASEIGKENRRV